MREIRSQHKIGQYRVAAGLSQKALSELAQCSVGTIHMLESGQSRLTHAWAERLSPLLGVSASDLLSASGTDGTTVPAVIAAPKRTRRKSLTASDSAKRAWATRRAKTTGLVPLPLPAPTGGSSLVERLTAERATLATRFEVVRAEKDRLERELGVLDTVIDQLSAPA